MAANAYLKEQVTGHIIEIIDEFIGIPAFPYFKSVLDVLFDRYSITNIQSLGFFKFDEIPILKWLYILDSKVSSFLSIFFSTSFSSVQTIADLESELFHYLTNLNFPTIASFGVINTIEERIDLNEIDIGIDIEDSTPIASNCGNDVKSNKVSTFDYFGLGPLSRHHMITTHFRLINTTGTALYAVTSSEILSHFLGFISNNQQFQHKDFDIHSFESYLLTVYNIATLSDIGVILCGDFSAEYLSYKSILNRHQQRSIDIQRQQLMQWNDQASLQHKGHNYDPSADLTDVNTILAQPLQPATTPSGSSSSAYTIKPSTRPLITQFMTQFDAIYKSTRGDNPYSPSFTQVYDILAASTIVSHFSQASNTNHNSNKTSKKRQRKDDKSIDQTLLSNMLTEVITDYLMLSQYGGTRFMKKRTSVIPHNSDPTSLPADAFREADDIDNQSENADTAAVNDEICVVSDTGADGSATKVSLLASAIDNVTQPATSPPLDPPSSSAACPLLSQDRPADAAASSFMASKIIDDGAVSENIATTTAPPPLPIADIQMMYSSKAPHEPAATEYEGKTQWNSPTNSSHKVIILTPESIHSPSIRSLLFSNEDQGDNTIYSLYVRDLQACLGPYISDDAFTTNTNIHTKQAHNSGNTSVDPTYTDLLRRVGLWGERLVYHILLLLSPPDSGATVHWLNEHEETRASYDILLTYKPSSSTPSFSSLHKSTHPSREKRQYIEVKTTRYNDNNIFELSLQEWEFATTMPRVQYSIYRVYNAGQLAKARVVVVPDVLRYIQCRRVKMCLALPSLG